MRVLDRPLPGALAEAIRDGRWRCPEDTATLKKFTGLVDAEHLQFSSLRGMEEDTLALRHPLDPNDDARLSLARKRPPGPEELDPMRAVVICATFGDGLVCLDYARTADEPRVVVTAWESESAYWRELSANVTDFLKTLGLMSGNDRGVAPRT